MRESKAAKNANFPNEIFGKCDALFFGREAFIGLLNLVLEEPKFVEVNAESNAEVAFLKKGIWSGLSFAIFKAEIDLRFRR